MADQQLTEGTWEETVRQAGELAASGKGLELIVPPDGTPSGAHIEARLAGRAYFGMFKGPIEATEEDFQEAEFHGDPNDGLDWRE